MLTASAVYDDICQYSQGSKHLSQQSFPCHSTPNVFVALKNNSILKRHKTKRQKPKNKTKTKTQRANKHTGENEEPCGQDAEVTSQQRKMKAVRHHRYQTSNQLEQRVCSGSILIHSQQLTPYWHNIQNAVNIQTQVSHFRMCS